MVDLGVVITWIAISAASVKGLSAFARAAAMNGAEAETATLLGDRALVQDGSLHALEISSRLLRESA
jgi:hypothetical protein